MKMVIPCYGSVEQSMPKPEVPASVAVSAARATGDDIDHEIEVEWLSEDSVNGLRVEAFEVAVSGCGHDDHALEPITVVLGKPVEDLEPAQHGHHEVHQHDVVVVLLDHSDRLSTVAGLFDLESGALEYGPHEAADRIVIVDDEYATDHSGDRT